MNIFLIGFIVSVLFVIFKFIEMRMLDKENEPIPLKYLVRDGLIVFASVIVGNFFVEQFGTMIETNPENVIVDNPKVFTDNPDF